MTASAAGSAIAAAQAHAERARQPVLGSRVHHAPLGSPGDRGLHVVGAPAQHHDGVGQARRRRPRRGRAAGAGRPSSGASSFGDPNRVLAPAARTTATTFTAVAPVATAASRARAQLAHRAARAGSPFRDDLGHDRERRLGRQPPAEVEPDRARAAGRAPPRSRRPRAAAPGGRAWVLREPTAPTYRQPRWSASTIAGSSNFTSWVSTATASAGPRPISSASSSGQPTMRRSTSGNRASVANAARPSMTTVS